MSSVDLSRFDNRWYKRGRPWLVCVLWFLFGQPLLRCQVLPFSSIRRILLRAFGATVGKDVVIRPGVRVDHPWLFCVGDHTWIGEDSWIDNLAPVVIGKNVCISQGAFLCTGNHDWSDPRFSLVIKPITLGDASWVCAKAVICPGVELGEGAVACAGSVVTRSVPSYEVHAGNPARRVALRTIRDTVENTACGTGI